VIMLLYGVALFAGALPAYRAIARIMRESASDSRPMLALRIVIPSCAVLFGTFPVSRFALRLVTHDGANIGTLAVAFAAYALAGAVIATMIAAMRGQYPDRTAQP
jgi:hypothetical protein